MKEIKTEIIINSKPEKVWSILTDFKNQPNWNPFISNISGEKFSGILVSLFGKMLDKTKDGFELMNKSLKSECEKEDDKERNWKEIPYKKNYTKEEIEESMRLSEKLYGDKDGSVKKN